MSKPTGAIMAAYGQDQTDKSGAKVRVDALERFIAEALGRVGVGPDDQHDVARALATTDSWHVFTHGVKCLPGYVARLKAKVLDAKAVPAVVGEGLSWARMDARGALGAVAGVAAMRKAIDKAAKTGIAWVGVRDSCHFGAAGYYAAMAAERGCVGVAMANDTPSMTVPGAKGRVLGNNPFAFAAPCGDSLCMLDMALSTVAGGKLMAAKFLGQPIPAEWSVDVDGNPTTDPNDFLAGGALTPMAGFKGFGLGLMVETLAAVLPGAALISAVRPWMVDLTQRTGHGAAFIAIDINAIMPRDEFDQRMRAMADEVRRAPRRAGVERITIPGELEVERRRRALRDGIPLPGDVVAAVRALAADLGIDITRLFS